ncbi:hypothetical protein O181_029521 [Austropuccinia psidii MF-1]|uniref:U3 small nucleolar RNA-associated protein 25 n=1 Tax=Austropuccinia psidii MF-1 TaxID=1389203 RepID=A0A9Q3H3D6_9BASI|nr:hypothetical protein [Austropuccinia psidii MF-1]
MIGQSPSDNDLPHKTDLARVKLLTLLNVVASKPSSLSAQIPRHEDRDWLGIAQQALKQVTGPTNGSIDSAEPLTSHKNSSNSNRNGFFIEKETIHPNETSQEPPDPDPLKPIDRYLYHFGPETSLLTPPTLHAAKSGDWNISSNEKSDAKRVVRFQLNHPPALISNISTILPSPLQTSLEKLNTQQSRYLNSINNYQDVWHTDIPYDHNRQHLRIATSFWALQHIIKTRNHIIKNNEYLARSAEKDSTTKPPSTDPTKLSNPKKSHAPNQEKEIRDQGFTRPKVLILAPFRSSARDWVNIFTSLFPSSNSSIKGQERFDKEFSLPEGTIDKLDSDDAPLKYSLEHRMIFRGNVDDDFRLAAKLNRKEIKLYADFYQADLIIASPLGLRKVIEKDGEADFLSSIEIAIVDQMDVMQMQNWDHLEFVFDHLNKVPSKPRDTDFYRVKPWYLDLHAAHLRQTILFSSFVSPEQNSLFRTLSNVAGKSIHFHQPQALSSGVLWKIRKGLQQTWFKFDQGPNESKESDVRLDFFKTKVLTQLEQSALVKAGMGGIMIFVPTYFEFVRLEQYMKSIEDLRYVAISEYSSNSEISAARSSFFNRHVSYLLVTERFHFYHRYKLRGARNIVFYGPPSHPEYYVEFCNEYPFEKGDQKVEEVKVQVLFNSLDQSKLERIVGLEDCKKMIKGLGTSFTFI